MSRELVNELTWSVSRDSLFRSCQRAYYYNYYGSWGGWNRDAPPQTRQLYILKNMSTLPMWAGSIVHAVIAEALQRHARKPAPIKSGELQARARQKLRGGWVEAVNGEWKTTPKKTNLAELYYGNGRTLPKEDTEACRERVNSCLDAFAHSAILAEILATPYLDWRPIDQLDNFLLDGGLKVWCAVDFAFSTPEGKLRIIDWKTGAEKADALRLQLACYALFAMAKWHTPLAGILVEGVFLAEGARVSRYPMEPALLAEAKETILSSSAAMRGMLADAVSNHAVEDDFPCTDKDYICQRCNFRELCPKMGGAQAQGQDGRNPWADAV